MKRLSIYFSKKPLLPIVLLIAIPFMISSAQYIRINTAFWISMGLCALGFAEKSSAKSARFLLPSLLLLGSFLFIPLSIFYYLGGALLVISCIEMYVGKMSLSVIFGIGIASPAFIFIENYIGFPVRIFFTKMVTHFLIPLFPTIQNKGSFIAINGNEFLIDEACAGLHMMSISFIISLFIFLYQEKKAGIKLQFHHLIIFLGTTFGLVIFCNFIRIAVLVTFQIPEYNPLHEAIGILCMVFYTTIPSFYLSRFLFKIPLIEFDNTEQFHGLSPIILYISILFFGIVSWSHYLKIRQDFNKEIALIQIEGFETSLYKNGLKIENESLLGYIKNPVSFYQPDHNPKICWKGSGYSFLDIQETKLGGIDVTISKIKKGDEELICCWWYQSKNHTVADNWSWRKLPKTEKFHLVNLASTNLNELEKGIEKIKVLSL